MVHPSQQYPQHPWPQPSFPQQFPGPPQHSHPGRFYSPPVGQSALLQPYSGARMLSQELAAAQSRLSKYTDLISNLYAELEMIHNLVCLDCKERISLSQHPSAFPSQVPFMPSPELHNLGQQTAPDVSSGREDGDSAAAILSPDVHDSPCSREDSDLPNTQLAPTCLPSQSTTSSTPTVSESTETYPPPETLPKSATEAEVVITRPVPEKTQNCRRSVTHNSETEKVLDVILVHAFGHPSSVNAVRFSPDGKFLAAGLTYDLGKTLIYDVETKSMRCALAEYVNKHVNEHDQKASLHIWSLCFSSDGRYVVAGASDGMARMWGIDSKRLWATFKGHKKDIRSLDISPNNLFLVTGSSRSVRIWKIRDGSSKVLSTDGKLFTSVRFSPNGRYAAASNTDQFLRIWDVRSGKLVGKWNGHGESLRSLAFSPNGKQLVSGSIVGAIMIKSWDVSSLKIPTRSGLSVENRVWEDAALVQKKEKQKFDGHSGEVRSTAISSDGKWVMTGSSDRRVRIWDAHTGVRHCTLDGHVDELWSVDFSPVGNYIAAASKDGFVTLWKYKTV